MQILRLQHRQKLMNTQTPFQFLLIYLYLPQMLV
nr:MAG TPA: hypothetical protein [Caudoviricetes sp.]DAW98175.1 MAG TPA: hypothetical protein [Bacteriophage sp.]